MPQATLSEPKQGPWRRTLECTLFQAFSVSPVSSRPILVVPSVSSGVPSSLRKQQDSWVLARVPPSLTPVRLSGRKAAGWDEKI